jgi:hypothetical protein
MSEQFVVPEWEGSAYQKMAKNYCYKHSWRVRHVLGDYDDCLSQCCLWYYSCIQFYKGKLNSPSHLMTLYRLWIQGQFNDLSTRDTNNRDVVQYKHEPVVVPEGDLEIKLQGASSELKQVLNIMFNAPQEVMEILRKDCQSYSPKQFFRRVVEYTGLAGTKTPELAKELQKLLS